LHGWSALILAGGAASRFGGGKLVADMAGAPVIRRVTEAVAAADFDELIVVTGAENARIRAALCGMNVHIINAPDWAEGMAASVRCGVAALAPETNGVCVFLGDMPLVPVALCEMVTAAALKAGYAARPRFEGKPGHPVAFTRAAYPDLMMLKGDQGANTLLRRRDGDVAYCDTDDSGALRDIDTREDLVAVTRAWKRCATSATSESAISRGALPKP